MSNCRRRSGSALIRRRGAFWPAQRVVPIVHRRDPSPERRAISAQRSAGDGGPCGPIGSTRGGGLAESFGRRSIADRAAPLTLKSLSIIGPGAAPAELGSDLGAAPHTVPEHDCRGIMAPDADRVHGLKVA